MAVFGVIGGVGRTVGPIIGAFFAEPAKTMPRVFRNTVFETYPFALPSVVLAVNCAVVMGMAYVMLQETLVFPDAIDSSDTDDDNDNSDSDNTNGSGGKNRKKAAAHNRILALSESPFNSFDENDNNPIQNSSGDAVMVSRDAANNNAVINMNTHTAKKMAIAAGGLEMTSLSLSRPRSSNKNNGAKQSANRTGYSSLPGSPNEIDDDSLFDGEDSETYTEKSSTSTENNTDGDVENPMHGNEDEETKGNDGSVSAASAQQPSFVPLGTSGKRVSFSALVQVKTIDSDSPPFNKNLKSVRLDIDVPLVHSSSTSSAGAGASNGGSSIYASMDQQTGAQYDEELGALNNNSSSPRNAEAASLLNGDSNSSTHGSDGGLNGDGLFPRHLRFDNGSSTMQLTKVTCNALKLWFLAVIIILHFVVSRLRLTAGSVWWATCAR
jgi:hypothetical protein